MSARTRIDALRTRIPFPYVRYSSEEKEVSAQVVKGIGVLTYLDITNTGATPGTVMIFDADGVPDDGATPVCRIPLPAAGDYPAHASLNTPVPVKLGAVAVFSLDGDTLEISEDGVWFYSIDSDEKL